MGEKLQAKPWLKCALFSLSVQKYIVMPYKAVILAEISFTVRKRFFLLLKQINQRSLRR